MNDVKMCFNLLLDYCVCVDSEVNTKSNSRYKRLSYLLHTVKNKKKKFDKIV